MIQRKDLRAKARMKVHLGVAQDYQGWIFWDPDLKQLFRSASVAFHRNHFLPKTAEQEDVREIKVETVFDTLLVTKIEAQDPLYATIQVLSTFCNGTPSTYQEAMEAKEVEEWRKACEDKLKSLEEMGAWTKVEKLAATPVLGTRWVFTLKTNPKGEVMRHKARLVVQGHRQIKGINIEETCALTPTFATLRSILAIASAFNGRVTTFDVTTAHLHREIDEDIYVQSPPGRTVNTDRVLKLNKVWYGLKQAGHWWWLHLKSILQDIGFRANEEDQSTYVYNHDGHTAILWIHVDDEVMATSDNEIWKKLRGGLAKRLKLKWDDTLSSIVGIEVLREGNKFHLKQSGLINKLISMSTNNFTADEPLPMANLELNAATQMDREYLSRIGMILYLAQAT
ncbi:hypothetical protein O181_117348 [Austropuccinia psidii MF-1]|uniref:Reverse transcriptase Ty1/copia-type domain-containing protein n=1 Tax=Austropuccinia psidii MF-1 TaxID=1389203 RepID=A0A9Q3K9Z9_9BASI|nr:hypothetical protein [Austropuccinia psidii MF-1]